MECPRCGSKQINGNANLYADTVEKKKDDAKELVAILNKIPEEKKGEVIGIVKGYALCAENQRR